MKINIYNTDKVRDALAEVNGRAKAHTITSWVEVQDVAEAAERRLSGLSKAQQVGARVHYVPAGPGKAYARKGRYVVTTQVELERFPSGWFLVGVNRSYIWAEHKEVLNIMVDESQRQALVEAALVGIIVA